MTNSWWMLLAARLLFLIFVLFFTSYLLFGDPAGEFIVILTAVLLLYAVAFPLLSVAAVYFDRNYVSTVSDWTPSLAYYAVIGPGIVAEPIVLVYLYQRHKYVGTP